MDASGGTAHVKCGSGRKVHIGRATGVRRNHYVTLCGMGGFVGSWLTLTSEPASCGSCVRKVEKRDL